VPEQAGAARSRGSVHTCPNVSVCLGRNRRMMQPLASVRTSAYRVNSPRGPGRPATWTRTPQIGWLFSRRKTPGAPRDVSA
jgi:hypothetical protein